MWYESICSEGIIYTVLSANALAVLIKHLLHVFLLFNNLSDPFVISLTVCRSFWRAGWHTGVCAKGCARDWQAFCQTLIFWAEVSQMLNHHLIDNKSVSLVIFQTLPFPSNWKNSYLLWNKVILILLLRKGDICYLE